MVGYTGALFIPVALLEQSVLGEDKELLKKPLGAPSLTKIAPYGASKYMEPPKIAIKFGIASV